ncbi:MAG TPA: VIT domain-containing protein [Chthoniobacterales bacterium]|nr:VIT domain-containing protein [Chthoniobacterales bacterium]
MKNILRRSAAQFFVILAIPLSSGVATPTAEPPDFAGCLRGVPATDRREGDTAPAPIPLPLKSTDVRLNISGGLVQGAVSQVFTNNTDVTLEAIYVFPLPSEATVIEMELRVGDRVIRSAVKEREEARQEYQAARKEGRKTALLEQERPNMFTTSVANFHPGETVQIHFIYLQAADYQRGKYGVTFPMVVGPRYVPEQPNVPDAERISPPLLHPSIDPGHRLTLTAEINGLPVKSITSSTHAIECMPRDAGKSYQVTLPEGATLPNCEFHLDIALTGTEEPELSVVTTDAQDATYALVTLFPPLPESKTPVRVPRDVLFLIDTSGSMSGESIGQAQTGLLRCLDMLQPEDTFTIVRFSSDHTAFSPTLEPAHPEQLDAARSYVRTLQADGGTEMQPALDYTLSIPSRRQEALRLVVFLTDGDVGNEDSLMRLLSAKLGATRVFTFGIGSAPNEFLMRRLAELGRGQARFIRSHQDIATVMADFFRTIDQPAMTNVRLNWRSAEAQPVSTAITYPQICPDVYIDRPVQIVAKLPRKFDGSLDVSGTVGVQQVQQRFALKKATHAQHNGISTLFGQAVVNDLMYQRLRTTDESQLKALRDQVVQTAMTYQLVTAFTSRIAIEEQITRAPDGSLASVRVPTMLPKGWSSSAFFPTATNDTIKLVIGLFAILFGLMTLFIARPRALR